MQRVLSGKVVSRTTWTNRKSSQDSIVMTLFTQDEALKHPNREEITNGTW